MKVYILSGLGADQRVFETIDFGPVIPVFLPWLPVNRNESLAAYALRMTQQIPEKQPVVLIGISFGGIVVQSIAQQRPVQQMILLSSVKNRYELPLAYRIIGKTRLHTIIPNGLFLRFHRLNYWFFGLQTPRDQHLLKSIIQDTSPPFFIWAIDKILRWEQPSALERCIHLHGTADRILPARTIRNAQWINGGGHLMTITHAEQVGEWLRENLSYFPPKTE